MFRDVRNIHFRTLTGNGSALYGRIFRHSAADKSNLEAVNLDSDFVRLWVFRIRHALHDTAHCVNLFLRDVHAHISGH